MRDSHVVLIADDPGFARDLMTRWHTQSDLPGLTVMSSDLLTEIGAGNFDLAIVGVVRNLRLASLLNLLDAADYPVICLLDNAADVKMAKSLHPRLHVMPHHEAWLDSLLLLANECLKRVDLAGRVRRAEQAALASSRGAALGRYVLESRHELNNSLTSVLGNAELLLLDADSFPASARDQLETIHQMALQIHEITQRFSSVAAEVRATENSSQDETKMPSHTTTTIQ
ncbi:MAG: histidine kinase dimerization/phospho-acceptor domain-containing protein [Candidatus Angelobacter sp.]